MTGKARQKGIVVNMNLSSDSDTGFDGFCKGQGGKLQQAIPGIDYIAPGDPRLIDPSGESSDSLVYSFPLNETITAGKIVQLMTDGKIQEVKAEELTESILDGSAVNFHTSLAYDAKIVFDPNNANKFVVAWNQPFDSYYGYVVAGTISGSTITLGTKYCFNYGNTQALTMDFFTNPADTIIIAWKDLNYSHAGYVRALTLSGLTFSSTTYYNFTGSGLANNFSVIADPSKTGKAVIVASNNTSGYIYTWIATVTGSTISLSGTSLIKYVSYSGSAINVATSKFHPTSGVFCLSCVIYTGGGYYTVIIPYYFNGTSFFEGNTVSLELSSSLRYCLLEWDFSSPQYLFAVHQKYASPNSLIGRMASVQVVNGTPTITLGAEYTLDATASNPYSITSDSVIPGCFVIAYGSTTYRTITVRTNSSELTVSSVRMDLVKPIF